MTEVYCDWLRMSLCLSDVGNTREHLMGLTTDNRLRPRNVKFARLCMAVERIVFLVLGHIYLFLVMGHLSRSLGGCAPWGRKMCPTYNNKAVLNDNEIIRLTNDKIMPS